MISSIVVYSFVYNHLSVFFQLVPVCFLCRQYSSKKYAVTYYCYLVFQNRNQNYLWLVLTNLIDLVMGNYYAVCQFISHIYRKSIFCELYSNDTTNSIWVSLHTSSLFFRESISTSSSGGLKVGREKISMSCTLTWRSFRCVAWIFREGEPENPVRTRLRAI